MGHRYGPCKERDLDERALEMLGLAWVVRGARPRLEALYLEPEKLGLGPRGERDPDERDLGDRDL